MPNFETFKKGASPREKRSFVTLQRTGPVSLNLAAYEALGRPEAIELLFDPAERIVGLRPSGRDNRNAYPVRPVGRATFVVAGRAFMKYYGIEVKQGRRFPARILDGVLAFELRSGEIRTSNRNGRRGTNGHDKRKGK